MDGFEGISPGVAYILHNSYHPWWLSISHQPTPLVSLCSMHRQPLVPPSQPVSKPLRFMLFCFKPGPKPLSRFQIHCVFSSIFALTTKFLRVTKEPLESPWKGLQLWSCHHFWLDMVTSGLNSSKPSELVRTASNQPEGTKKWTDRQLWGVINWWHLRVFLLFGQEFPFWDGGCLRRRCVEHVSKQWCTGSVILYKA